MLPMQEFTLDYFEQLIKIDANLDISLEVATLVKTYHTSAAGSRIHPLVFLKIEYRKKRFLQKAYENHIN